MTPAQRLLDHVRALSTEWRDPDDVRRVGLFWLLTAHLSPVHMATIDHSVKMRIMGGTPPWDVAVASWLMDVHAGCRELEQRLAWVLFQRRQRRPGSDGHTRLALHNVGIYGEAAYGKGGEYLDVAEDASAWAQDARRKAELLLGAERRWARIRWTDVEGAIHVGVCPYCAAPLLVQPDLVDDGDPTRWREPQDGPIPLPEEALARCPNPTCKDEEGRRYTWPLTRTTGRLLTGETK